MVNKHNFNFITPVWGNEYTDLYIKTCLPMLLTDGNLKSRKYSSSDKFTIVTTQKDAATIQSSEIYKNISSLITVELLLADHLLSEPNTYRRMSSFYRLAMSQNSVTPLATYFIFLTPDSFWSEGTLKRVMELADSGIKVALAPGFRVNLEEVSELLSPYISQEKQHEILEPAVLTKTILQHSHNMTNMQVWQQKKTFNNTWPSNLLWIDHEQNQIFAHCLHLHPLLVLAPENNIEIGTSIDGEFISSLNYDTSDYFICHDGCFGAELSSKYKTWGDNTPLSFPSIKKVADFAIIHSNQMHRHFFKHRISLPDGAAPCSELEKNIKETTDKIIDSYSSTATVYITKLKNLTIRIINRITRLLRFRHPLMR